MFGMLTKLLYICIIIINKKNIMKLKDTTFVTVINLTVKQLKNMCDNIGIEIENYPYNQCVLNKIDKLKYYQSIVCRTFQLNGYNLYIYYVANEHIDKKRFFAMEIKPMQGTNASPLIKIINK